MRLMLCGGTGFIGKALTQALLSRGDEVWIVTRTVPVKPPYDATLPHPHYVTWAEWKSDANRMGDIDGIVNLAGESINQRWSEKAKERILSSRIEAAANIADNLGRMNSPPNVVVNASGISLYGHSGEQVFDESSSARPADFLGTTVVEWEKAADRIPVRRLVKLRIGLVCAREGGAFPLIHLPYRLFGGGRMGNGKQGLPWIHLQDMVSLILFCLDNPAISGPVNAVAPDPVSNDEFGRILGKVTRRPHWFPVPAVLLRSILGEMSTLVLFGQKAMPRKALEHGFVFAFPKLEGALREITR
ncbi:TIGR01777 family oxidoreductase [Cohnella silvisoli]|uniref:TIGR01777 family oxidoreductase n=1 Tax=Cohnella silvisoli TaxID=2873699 RepID=A0ABV1KYA4_9BACL|nr:TIGR01777 family oxidoreductase [Cohnella silvisoli]MCD9024042.1 TIGR01777 family oxidoreductase [Cohnella silvisoli]